MSYFSNDRVGHVCRDGNQFLNGEKIVKYDAYIMPVCLCVCVCGDRNEEENDMDDLNGWEHPSRSIIWKVWIPNLKQFL